MSKWQVIDTTSSCMPSMKTVIDEFETLVEAVELSKTTDEYRIRTKPLVRSRKSDSNETPIS